MFWLLATTEIERVSRFGLIGIFNTVIDFLIFNALSGKTIGMSKVWANTVSTTIAMTFSFFANRNFVFSGHGNEAEEALLFFGITAFGLYVLQNGVIYLLTSGWDWPRKVTARFTASHHVPLETDFVLKNGAKVAGTVLSLTWNYIMYGRVVFHG